MRVASVRAARRKLVKLFRKPNSRFYWYDFTVRGHRYRRSTQETKLARAAKAASVKLGSVIEGTDPFPSKPSVLSDFAERFDTWIEDGRLEKKTKKFYRNGWRLLKATPVAGLRVDQITGDFAEQLKFPGSAANANCALRTLRRMLHKAEEWKVIGHAPKIKMMKEHGRHLRLLYCVRHDYGTRVLMRTGNLAAVLRTIGHGDVKTAMHYQHPELEIVRAALDYRPPNSEAVV